ncbi:MAG TPA: Asp23/Gls24 family envelope stress response protein [Clostridiales bacterium]|nr:Asp23/Gls24 family envelope stress response protein [Clostridiales bacterium]
MVENLTNESVEVVEIIHGDKLKIADEVIETIAGIEASKVQYVTSMSGGFTDGLAGFLGKKNLGKGVRVEATENEVKVFLSITVEYGCKIHVVAKNVQNIVRTSIEEMTGMKVLEVNVSVAGINFPKEPKEPKIEEQEKA